MASIFSLTSHVVYGHVGGQAAVPAWHLLGHEVWHLPTVMFSNHPGHGGYGGGPVALALQNDLLDGLAARNLLAGCAALHTGYLGQPGSVDVALRAIAAMPEALVLCDPVLGDTVMGDAGLGDAGGLYVAPELAAGMRDRLLPKADIVTPNRFELAWLTGQEIHSLEDAVQAAQSLRRRGPKTVICTGAALAGGWLCNLAVGPDGIFQVQVPYLDDRAANGAANGTGVPKGTGDAFAAILLGHYLNHGDMAAALAWASAALHGLIQASIAMQSDELAVIKAQNEITAPSRMFEVERLG